MAGAPGGELRPIRADDVGDVAHGAVWRYAARHGFGPGVLTVVFSAFAAGILEALLSATGKLILTGAC